MDLQKYSRYLVGAVIVLLAFVSFFAACTTYVAPNEVAIKESRLLPPKGVSERVYEGGRVHFLFPGQQLHRFPTDIQVLEMVRSRQVPRYDNTRVEPDVEINTSDGSRVWVDVTVFYRISDSYAVMTGIGPGRQYEDTIVIPRTKNVLKQHMGELNAEDFYDVEKRVLAARETEALLAQELKLKGLELSSLLIRQYRYLGNYENEIRAKKIKDQLYYTQQSEARAASEEAVKKEIEAEGQANVAVELERGKAEVTKINAAADAYARKKRAEADLLIQLAEAEGTQALNNAYRGIGSENLVGLEMAEVLEGMDVIIVPTGGENGMNPLDLDDTLRMFDVQ